MKFRTPEEMLYFINRGSDLYSAQAETYIFSYNNAGSVCTYHISPSEAKDLEAKAKEVGEYWSALLGVGGSIWDDPSYDGYREGQATNLDICASLVKYNDWVIVGSPIPNPSNPSNPSSHPNPSREKQMETLLREIYLWQENCCEYCDKHSSCNGAPCKNEWEWEWMDDAKKLGIADIFLSPENTVEKAIKVLDSHIPHPLDGTVDKEHLDIALAWKTVKDALNPSDPSKIGYDRLEQICQDLIDWLAGDGYVGDGLKSAGMSDEEIKALGFAYLIEEGD